MDVKEFARWGIDVQGSIENLVLGKCKVPELGNEYVLVKIQAVSLNYRDLVLVKVGLHFSWSLFSVFYLGKLINKHDLATIATLAI